MISIPSLCIVHTHRQVATNGEAVDEDLSEFIITDQTVVSFRICQRWTIDWDNIWYIVSSADRRISVDYILSSNPSGSEAELVGDCSPCPESIIRY